MQTQPPRIPWMDLALELGGSLQKAIDTRKNERIAIDKETSAVEREISSYEAGQNQKFSELVFNGVDKGRDLIYDWNLKAKRGEITKAELKLRMNNLSEGLSGFATSAKQFDERMVKVLERQNSGEAGRLESYKNKRMAEMAILKGSEYYTDPNTGKGFIIKKDDEGNVISKQDANRVNNPGNILGLKVNLQDEIKDIVDTWKDVSIETPGYRGSSTTETGVAVGREAEFNKSKLAVIQSVLANPDAIFSVLADNSKDDYEPYTTESEKQSIINERVEFGRELAAMNNAEFNESEFRADQEKFLVQLVEDETGVLQPSLTQQQIEAAKEVVSTAIDMQIGYKKSVVAPRAYSGGGRSTKEPKEDHSIYPMFSKAWNLSKSNSEESARALNALLGGEYIVKWAKGGLEVRKRSDLTKDTPITSPLFIARNLRDLAPIMYGHTTAAGVEGSYAAYDKDRKGYKSNSNQKPSAY